MTTGARERIVERIRAALGGSHAAGLRAGVDREQLFAHPANPRPRIDGDLVANFKDNALRLSTTIAAVQTLTQVPAAAAGYLHERHLPLRAVCWPALSALDWAGSGIEVEARTARDSDMVGITGVVCAVAETGSLMVAAGAQTPSAVSLLPETHIAILQRDQIVAGMEEAWRRLREYNRVMPRAVNFISGPSRTADIEQTVTLGAHGPYRVHVIVVDG